MSEGASTSQAAPPWRAPRSKRHDAPRLTHVELKPILHDALDVKALRRHGTERGGTESAMRASPRPQRHTTDALRNVLIRHALQDCRLASIVQAKHQDARLLVRLLELAQEVQEALRRGRGWETAP